MCSGQTFATRILRQRTVDARMHMRIDETRERQTILAVDDLFGFSCRNTFGDLLDLAIDDTDVELLHAGLAGSHDTHVLDQQIIFLGFLSHRSPVKTNS